MEVTDIQPRRHSLSALFLDGELAALIDKETLLLSPYKVGSIITEEQLEALSLASDRRRAKEKALYLLEYRSHTKKELWQKLRRSFPPERCDEAVAEMERLSLLDDADYAIRYAKELFTRKGYGKRRVAQELRQKGIEPELIGQLCEELEEDPTESMVRLLEKKYPRYREDEKIRRRAVAALQRMGYSYSEIFTVIPREAFEENT